MCYFLEETKENCVSCYYFLNKNILNKKVTFKMLLNIKEREDIFLWLYQV